MKEDILHRQDTSPPTIPRGRLSRSQCCLVPSSSGRGPAGHGRDGPRAAFVGAVEETSRIGDRHHQSYFRRIACSYRRSFPPRRYVGPNGIVDFLFLSIRSAPRGGLVFDVRFLANPRWVDGLRPLTRNDPAVGAYVAADPECEPFLESFDQMLQTLIPLYIREGKAI